MKLSRIFKLKALPLLVGGLMCSQAANSAVFTLYDYVGEYVGDGSELAQALNSTGNGIVSLSNFAYQGNFDHLEDPGGGYGGYGGVAEVPAAVAALPGDPSAFASAAFFSGLDLGTVGSTHFALNDGILLTSGNANLANSNTESGFTGYAGGLGDAGLDALLAAGGIGEVTRDATVLSFDFTVEEGVNAIALDFIFGSEEFPEFADSYPEIAAIFVDGTNAAGFGNGDLLTVTSAGIASGNFVDNNGNNDGGSSPLAIEYDGVSRPLTAVGVLDPSKTVHSIKIAVSDTGDTVLDTGIFVSSMRGLTVEGGGAGSDPGDPLLPGAGDDPNDGFDFQIFVGDLGFGIDPTQPIFFDPVVAIGYEFTSSLPVATVQVNSDLGDGIYELWYWDGVDYVSLGQLLVNDIFDFVANGLTDILQFKIDGIEASAMVDPNDDTAFVTGLTFVSGGTLNLNMTPITFDTDSAGVPLPASLGLLALGLLGMRRRLQHS